MVEGFFSLQPGPMSFLMEFGSKEEHIPKHDAMFVDILCMLFLPHHSGFSSMRRRASKSAWNDSYHMRTSQTWSQLPRLYTVCPATSCAMQTWQSPLLLRATMLHHVPIVAMLPGWSNHPITYILYHNVDDLILRYQRWRFCVCWWGIPLERLMNENWDVHHLDFHGLEKLHLS